MKVEVKVDLSSWYKTLHLAADKTKEASEKVFYSVGTQLYNQVITYTPVGDPSLWSYVAPKGYYPGTLKKSWQINYTPIEITIQNQQPYAERVEYGWSTQAPYGMLRLALKDFDDLLNKAAAEYKL